MPLARLRADTSRSGCSNRQWTNDGFASSETGYGPPTSRPSTAGDGDQRTSTQPGGEPTATDGIVFVEYKVIKEPPAEAKVVIPPDGKPIRGGDPLHLLIAPPHADYGQIYRAGEAIAEFPPWKQYDYVCAAIGQEGNYDFQRDVASHKFYSAYTPAANYAVGVYMAGAGYALDVTLTLAKLYALRNSSNYGAEDQLGWIKRGWRRQIGAMAVAILSGWRARLTGNPLRLAVSVIALLVVGIGAYYPLRYIEALIALSSVVGSHDFVEDWAKNGRGDKVYIRTDTSPRLDVPDRTVVRLRRAHAWFSTTLVAIDSFGVQERLEWINNDTLEVALGFGCLKHMTPPVETVGSIRISYHFSDGDRTLAKGCPG